MIRPVSIFMFSFFLANSLSQNPSFAENVSAAKYKDFYNHKKAEERRAEEREKGRLAFKQKRELEEKNYEKLAENFAKQNSRKKQIEYDQTAEEWMAKQDKLHEERLDRARKDYILSKKDKYKYKIPESEEYEVK